ncbi:hypothetical protein [Microbulbifer pacificus]|uniref:hypothetical protein n=1 Tax=Microbulbifer pacificus TaxID=407164 RepID=UPI00131A3C7C|nr:hypothetical protein [Microbulbifer pacificus]
MPSSSFNTLIYLSMIVFSMQISASEFSSVTFRSDITTQNMLLPTYELKDSGLLRESALLDPTSGHIPDDAYTGFYVNDVQVSATEDELVRIENYTPRHFSGIALYKTGLAFYLPESLPPFTFVELSIADSMVSAGEGDKLAFLDPNPQFRSSPSDFHASNKLIDIESYRLILNHMKQFYARKSTRDDFMSYFKDHRDETSAGSLAKWHKTLTYRLQKSYRVNQSGSAGVASSSWLSINWPMSYFNADRSYNFAYSNFSHENAHTMGYSHSSGLAYGWDDFVSRGIPQMFSEGVIEPGETPHESANIYMAADGRNKSVILFAKPGFSGNVREIRVVGEKSDLEYAYVSGSRIYFDLLDRQSHQPLIISVEVEDSERLEYLILEDFLSVPSQKNRTPHYLLLNETSTIEHDVNGKIYFYIPFQDGIASTDGLTDAHRSHWNGVAGHTNILAWVRNISTGKRYQVKIRGRKGNYKLENGAPSDRQIRFNLDPDEILMLPAGQYEGEFEVVAAGWNVTSYRKSIHVRISFSSDRDRLLLNEWSKNYSLETPSGDSSVYFFTPRHQDVETDGPQRESRHLWSGAPGETSLHIKVVGDDGKSYSVDIKAQKYFMHGRRVKIEDGVQRGYGQVIFTLDKGSDRYWQLPEGQNYRGSFYVIAQGWHNTGYSRAIDVSVDFRKPDEDLLKLDQWSRNYSLETPQRSSVYFYAPVQPGLSTDGPQEESRVLWAGQPGKTSLIVDVVGEDGQVYPIDMIGQKLFFNGRRLKMEDGVQRGFGQVMFTVDKNSPRYLDLPKDQAYSGAFYVIAHGWHDTSYIKMLKVVIDGAL